MEERIDFEKELNRLKDILEKIQNSKISLDESLLLYQEGQEIIKVLTKELSDAEAKIEKVVEID